MLNQCSTYEHWIQENKLKKFYTKSHPTKWFFNAREVKVNKKTKSTEEIERILTEAIGCVHMSKKKKTFNYDKEYRKARVYEYIAIVHSLYY